MPQPKPKPTSPRRPTLAEIRRWPPTVPVSKAATALGISRTSMYSAISSGDCPIQTITVNRRLHVLTASLIAVLDPAPARTERRAS